MIKRALISVSNKEGIEDFAKELDKLGVEILSTGGTAKTLKKAGITSPNKWNNCLNLNNESQSNTTYENT